MSGKSYLDFNGLVNTVAPNGNTGMLLLDPANVTISNAATVLAGGAFAAGQFAGATGPVTLNWTTAIDAQLVGNNVIITTSGNGGGLGDITVSADSPALARANTLWLVANNDITLNGAITNTGGGTVGAFAGWNGNAITFGTAPVLTSGTGTVTVNQSINVSNVTGQNIDLRAGKDIVIAAGKVVSSLTGLNHGVTLKAAAGNISLGAGSTVSATPFIALGNNGSATVAISAGGNVSLDTGSTVSAKGGQAGFVGIGFASDGGNASTSIAAGGTIGITASTVTATGGAGIGAATGDGTLTLNSTGATTISGASTVRAQGGGANASVNGRPGTLNITASALTLNGTGPLLVESIGGKADQLPGAALTNLNVAGVIDITGDSQLNSTGGAHAAAVAGGDGADAKAV